jgi:hypothetical protein
MLSVLRLLQPHYSKAFSCSQHNILDTADNSQIPPFIFAVEIRRVGAAR